MPDNKQHKIKLHGGEFHDLTIYKDSLYPLIRIQSKEDDTRDLLYLKKIKQTIISEDQPCIYNYLGWRETESVDEGESL